MQTWVGVVLRKKEGSDRILLFAPRNSKEPQEKWLFGLPGERALPREEPSRASVRIMKTLYGAIVDPVGDVFYSEVVPDKFPHHSPNFFQVVIVEKTSGGSLEFDPKLGISKWCSPEEVETLYKQGRISPKHIEIIVRYFEEVLGEKLVWFKRS